MAAIEIPAIPPGAGRLKPVESGGHRPGGQTGNSTSQGVQGDRMRIKQAEMVLRACRPTALDIENWLELFEAGIWRGAGDAAMMVSRLATG